MKYLIFQKCELLLVSLYFFPKNKKRERRKENERTVDSVSSSSSSSSPSSLCERRKRERERERETETLSRVFSARVFGVACFGGWLKKKRVRVKAFQGKKKSTKTLNNRVLKPSQQEKGSISRLHKSFCLTYRSHNILT